MFDALDTFTRRHVGPQDESVDRMLRYLGASSLDALVDECMPASIREHSSDGKGDFLKDQGAGKGTIEPLSERELLARARQFARQNKVFRSFIGLGYHQAVRRLSSLLRYARCSPGLSLTCQVVPPVILRNMTGALWLNHDKAQQCGADILAKRREPLLVLAVHSLPACPCLFSCARILGH